MLELVKLHPLTGIKAFQQPEAGGAWRLYVIAKNLAGALDHIEREAVIRELSEQGVSKVQIKRWMTAARNYDLVRDIQRKSGEWMFILPSYTKAAELFGMKDAGKSIELQSSLLFTNGWRAHIFAAWQSQYTSNGERLVSQKKQEEVTGIDPQTQRQFNKEAGVVSSRNYAISNQHASMRSGLQEYGQRACVFEFWDKDTHQKKIGWRIPDSRVLSPGKQNFSNQTPGKMRLFNRTADQYAETMKTLKKLSEKDTTITTKEIYVYCRLSAKGNSLWTHCAI